MNDLTQYYAAEASLQPGDLVVFFARRNPVSWLIELFTAGPSHVAVVRQPAYGGPATLIESTILDGRNGVQTHPIDERIAKYGAGDIACLHLTPENRARLDLEAFYAFCGAAQDHVRYDVADLFEFLGREVPIIGARAWQDQNGRAMVCSGFATALWEKAGLLRGLNWSDVAPQDLVEMGLYSGYSVLLGAPRLRRFNSQEI